MSFRTVACCRANPDAGYATPAALALSLTFGLIATAFLTQSMTNLSVARGDLVRTQTEYALDGAVLAAAADIVRSTTPPPYHWSLSTDAGLADVVAEPEKAKLSFAAASQLDDAMLADLGVNDPDALRGSLSMAAGAAPDDAGQFDAAELWRRCARRLITGFGGQSAYTYVAPNAPGLGEKLASWHIGEVWRLRITTTTGWRDERIVRFTGDAGHPVATVTRKLSRDHGDGGQCDTPLQAISAAAAQTMATP
jgi:hypothetical protein